jgi:hypothetical protein
MHLITHLDLGSGTEEQYWLLLQDSLQQHSGSSQSTRPSVVYIEKSTVIFLQRIIRFSTYDIDFFITDEIFEAV